MFSLCTFWRCTLSVICSIRWHMLPPQCAFHPLSADRGLIRSAFLWLILILCRKFLIQYVAQPLLHRKYNTACGRYLAQLISSFPVPAVMIGESTVYLGSSPVRQQHSRKQGYFLRFFETWKCEQRCKETPKTVNIPLKIYIALNAWMFCILCILKVMFRMDRANNNEHQKAKYFQNTAISKKYSHFPQRVGWLHRLK